MTTGARTFDERTAALVDATRGVPGAVALVLLGSAARGEAARRDEWSDHDFWVLADAAHVDGLRDVRAWLPDGGSVAAVAREGDVGFAVLYDDGHVMEFAAATAAELHGAAVVHHDIVFDDGSVQALVDASRARDAAPGTAPDPANDVALVLVKLLIGVGRARRGEAVSAGQMVRQWAVQHLLRAVRARVPAAPGVTGREAIDPARRFEAAYPELGARLADVLARPVEDAARGVYDLVRDVLEPGWDAFPTRAADAVATRLGWS